MQYLVKHTIKLLLRKHLCVDFWKFLESTVWSNKFSEIDSKNNAAEYKKNFFERSVKSILSN